MSTDELVKGWARTMGADRRQFNMFFEKMMDAFAYHRMLFDERGKPVDYFFLEVNSAFERMTGLRREEVLGRKASEVLPGIEGDPTDWIGKYGGVASTGEAVEFEAYFHPTKRWFRVGSYCPEKGYFVALFDDITERKKAEDDLRLAKSDWERTFDSIPDLVAILDPNYRIIRMNKAMAQQLRTTPEKAVGLVCYECVHGTSGPPSACPHAQSLRDNMGHTSELREPRLGGDFIVSTTPLLDDKGVMVGCVHVARNITERKMLEDALHESERRYRILVDSAPDAIIVHLEGKLLFANPEALRLYGASSFEELAKYDILKLMPLGETGITGRRVEAIMGGERQAMREGHIARLNGEVVPIEVVSGPIEYGGSLAIQSIIRDSTDRVRAQDALRQSEEEFRTLVTASSDVVYRMSADWSEMRELRGKEFIPDTNGPSQSWLDKYIHPDDQEGVLAVIRRAVESKGKFELEHRVIRVDGSLGWTLSRAIPLMDKDGNIVEWLGTAKDITERKAAERALEEAQAQLKDRAAVLERLVEERTKELRTSSLYARSLIEASIDPLVTINVEGKITDVNRATELATGEPGERLIGSDFSGYFTDPEKARIGYRTVLSEGSVRDYPLSIRHRSGRITEVLYNATLFRNEAGEVQGIFAAARDVTEHNLLERKLKDAERLAAVGATAGMVGHDIRNPLQVIIGELYIANKEMEGLRDSRRKVEVRESLEEIEKSVEYINKILLDLQDFSKPLTPVSSKVDLEAMFDSLLKKGSIPGSIKVVSEVAGEAKEVVTDEGMLRRILSNLVSNAVEAMPNGGDLSLSACREGGNVVIAVEDTGVGIPDEEKPRLFTPLFTTKAKGQGFGLAVVSRLTQALGGDVSFESEIGKGTKFVLRLPGGP